MFNDFDNVKNPYLKNILLNKIAQAKDKGINVYFECHYPINKLNIQPYDLVRIIEIMFDNAIEAVLNKSTF